MSAATTTDVRIVNEFPMLIFRPRCPKCNETFAKPPLQWNCPTCQVKCWQRYEQTAGCAVCGVEVGALNRRHCHLCGHVVCNDCGQYFMALAGAANPQDKERVCKGCAFPPNVPDVTGMLVKVSRDLSGRETSRNSRYYELRKMTLLYGSERGGVFRGFYNVDGCKVADDVEEPALGFSVTGGKLPHPIYLIADKVSTKIRWVNAVMSASHGNTMTGTDAFASTEMDGFSGFMDLIDGGGVRNKYFFRIKGTVLSVALTPTSDPVNTIILHGGTIVADDAANAYILLLDGPKLPGPLKLVCSDESTRNAWRNTIITAMRGGRYSQTDLPPVTLKATVECTRAPAADQPPVKSTGLVVLREHILVWGNDPPIEIRGTTVGVDPHRARTISVSGGAAVPPLVLVFDEDDEFSYWKECMQCVASGKPMPLRRFTDAPTIQGFLTKVGTPKGISGSVALNRRYFRLFQHYLQYADDNSGPAKAEFNILEAEISESAQYPLGLFISGPRTKRPVILIADSEGDRDRWEAALVAAAGTPPPVPGRPNIRTGTVGRKGIGLPPGVRNVIDLQVGIEIALQTRRSGDRLAQYHGSTVPLRGLDASTLTLQDLQNIIESTISVPPAEVPGQLSGVLFVPGRYISFRRLGYDSNDVASVAAKYLDVMRGDDDVAGLLHRLPTTTFLDEVPLRNGDKLVWKDFASRRAQQSQQDQATSSVASPTRVSYLSVSPTRGSGYEEATMAGLIANGIDGVGNFSPSTGAAGRYDKIGSSSVDSWALTPSPTRRRLLPPADLDASAIGAESQSQSLDYSSSTNNNYSARPTPAYVPARAIATSPRSVAMLNGSAPPYANASEPPFLISPSSRSQGPAPSGEPSLVSSAYAGPMVSPARPSSARLIASEMGRISTY